MVTGGKDRKIRVFIAIELSEEVKEELSRVARDLKRSGADVKWIRSRAMHLTLKFLGDISGKETENIGRHLGEIASRTAPFDMVLSGVGVFPDWDRVKVVWADIGAGGREAENLAKAVDDRLAGEGFPAEGRKFRPHLTLGRVRSGKGRRDLKNAALKVKVEPAKSTVDKIVIFRSELTSAGAVHTPLAFFELSG
jgi:RNA 2',3'-cyclic 3'-phosphodiesterase